MPSTTSKSEMMLSVPVNMNARNLGVGFDHYFDFSEQVKMTCKMALSAFAVLPRLGDIYPITLPRQLFMLT